jgi:hypothetical protein
MDLWNNDVGRKLALRHKAKDKLVKAVKEALEAGRLIVTPHADQKTSE